MKNYRRGSKRKRVYNPYRSRSVIPRSVQPVSSKRSVNAIISKTANNFWEYIEAKTVAPYSDTGHYSVGYKNWAGFYICGSSDLTGLFQGITGPSRQLQVAIKGCTFNMHFSNLDTFPVIMDYYEVEPRRDVPSSEPGSTPDTIFIQSMLNDLGTGGFANTPYVSTTQPYDSPRFMTLFNITKKATYVIQPGQVKNLSIVQTNPSIARGWHEEDGLQIEAAYGLTKGCLMSFRGIPATVHAAGATPSTTSAFAKPNVAIVGEKRINYHFCTSARTTISIPTLPADANVFDTYTSVEGIVPAYGFRSYDNPAGAPGYALYPNQNYNTSSSNKFAGTTG